MTATSTTAGRLRPMAASDLELVLEWRNHIDIRRHMYTGREITLEEHRRWFERVSRDTAYHLFIFEIDSLSSGFLQLHQAAPGGVADWGFYVAPNAPKGVGRQLGLAGLHHAFSQLGFHKICGEAIATNERSVRFHQNLGFRQEGVLRKQHFDGQIYHDVIFFGLLRDEWRKDSERS